MSAQIVMFGEDVILNKPISEWPVVDCLIAFYSKGEKNGTKRGAEFPLEKAEQYVALRRPFCVNNLASERILMDRYGVVAAWHSHTRGGRWLTLCV